MNRGADDPDRWETLRALLDAPDLDSAHDFWFTFCRPDVATAHNAAVRKLVANAKKEKRKLRQVEASARKIINILETSFAASELLNCPQLGEWLRSCEECREKRFSSILVASWLDDDEYGKLNYIPSIVHALRQVAKSAAYYEQNDAAFRRALRLPNPAQSTISPEALILWPRIFEYWESIGNKVAATPCGPLHRLLQYVHSELRLAEPTADALQGAVARYIGSRGQTLPPVPNTDLGVLPLFR